MNPFRHLALRSALLAVLAWLLVGCSSFTGGKENANATSGEKVFLDHCAGCHNSGMGGDGTEAHVPPQSALRQMPASRILRALDFGAMMTITYALTRDERVAVANYLGLPDDGKPPVANFCADRSVTLSEPASGDWVGWSPGPDGRGNARFQEHAGFTEAQVGRLKLKWVIGFDGDINAFAPPAVLGNYLFVGSAAGLVQALDRNTGCTKWVYQADGPVRSAMPVAPLPDGKHAVMFGDQTGWFYAVEAESGKQLWKVKAETHEATKLTGSPVVHDGIVYVPTASWEEGRPQNASYQCCTFRGSVVAYKIADGTQIWKTYMIPNPPAPDGKQVDGHAELGPSGIGIWSAPTIDTKRGRLYVSTGNTYSGSSPNSDAIVALELATGKILWASQVLANDTFNGGCFLRGGCAGPDADFGASPILVEGAGGKSLLLAGQKSGMVYAMDADHEGVLVWKQRVGKGGINGGVQFGMAADAANVYAAVSDVGRVARAQKGKVDARPNGVDPNVGGGLTALRIRDGVKAWYAAPAKCDPARPMCSPAQPAAVAAMPGVVFSGNVDGYLRAYSTRDGKVLWEFDTNKDWTAEGKVVNGVKTRGGSIDGAGPVIADGMVFVPSGYARNGAQGGNALLAFGIE